MIKSHPLISIVLIALAVRPLVVLLHEMGHALIAIYYSRQKATIYLGSHGDRAKSASVEFGLLEVWFTGNPFLWQFGVCIPSGRELTIRQKFIYVFAGPVLPVLVAIVAVYLTVAFHLNEYVLFIALTFLGTTLIDVFINLAPNSTPINLLEGTTFNDGYSLKLLLLQKKFPLEYFKAIDHYSKAEYPEATLDFERAFRKRPNDKNIHLNLIEAYFAEKNFEGVKDSYETYSQNYHMTSDDYGRLATAWKHLGNFVKAKEYFEKVKG